MLAKYYAGRLDPYTIFDPFQLLVDASWTRSSTVQKNRINYNVVTDENSLTLKVDVPGVKREHLKVELNDRTLTISGKRDKEDLAISYKISKDFNIENPEAKLEDGVLTLRFSKLTETGSSKIIVVK